MLKKIFITTVTFTLLINNVIAGSLSGKVNFEGKPPKKKNY